VKFIDAYILASTKRKTRRIRTALVIIVSSLLFALLFALALVAGGFKDAIGQVKDVGFNGRNIAGVVNNAQSTPGGQSDYETVVNGMKDELRARGIKVTVETERDQSFGMEVGRRLGKLFSQRQAEAEAKLEQQVKDLGNPRAIYHFKPMSVSSTDLVYQPDSAKDPLIDEMKAQVETGVNRMAQRGENGLSFFTVEGDMLRTQLHPGQTYTGWTPGAPYPIFVSYSYLEKLAGKSFARLSNAKKNDGYRQLMREYGGREVAYCYRNYTAQDQLQQVLKYNYDAERDNKTDTKPVAVPVCAGLDQALLKKVGVIVEPVKPETKPLFTPEPIVPPETSVIHMKIIGFVPSPPQYGTSDPITSLLSGISALPTPQYPGIFPTEVVRRDPRLKAFISDVNGYQPASLFADFKTRAEERAFIDKSCQGNECSSGKAPYIVPFGSLEMAFTGLIKNVMKGVLIGVSIIAFIAGLMIMFTISKVIADSTKEIAVFRALGARRRDIAQVYFTYGLMLTGSAAVCAFVLASIASFVVSHMFAERVAAGLVAGAGAYNQALSVRLWGVEPIWLLCILGALAAAAFIGITIPVLANLRRKLINALREE
jgi:hypothetical protein